MTTSVRSDGDDHRARGGGGHQHETRHEGAHDGTGRTDGRQAPDHRAGDLEIPQLQLHDRGVHRAEDGGGKKEPDGRQPDDVVGRSEPRMPGGMHGRRRQHRQRAAPHHQRAQRPAGIDPVGQPAPQPCTQRDPGQDDADDRGVRLQAHPDIRSQ